MKTPIHLSRARFSETKATLLGSLPTSDSLALQPRVFACLPESGPPIDDDLQYWQSLPRLPLYVSEDPFVQALIATMKARERFTFIYLGGSTPGSIRHISPGLVFMLEEFPYVYVMGYCHLRQEERVFRLDRMEQVIYH
jgi:predicted DNA-binding transcriptional regulator YafY